MKLEKLENILSELGAVFLFHVGELSQELIASLAGELEANMKKDDIPLSDSIKVFSVFIELVQSINDYSKNSNFSEKNSLIYIGKEKHNKQYYIESKNVIFKDHKDFLENAFNRLSKLSKKEEKVFYKEFRKTLDLTRFENRVVISFLEVIKKCEKFTFRFSLLGENKFNFVFTAYI